MPAGSGSACRTMQEWLWAGSLLAAVMTNALPVRAERYARQRQRPRHATRAASCELRRELTFDLFGTRRRTGSSSSGVGYLVWAADGDGAETCVVVGGTRSVADATAGQRVSTNLGFRRRALPLSCHQQGRVELQSRTRRVSGRFFTCHNPGGIDPEHCGDRPRAPPRAGRRGAVASVLTLSLASFVLTRVP